MRGATTTTATDVGAVGVGETKRSRKRLRQVGRGNIIRGDHSSRV